jgi:hypothetical protein
MAEDELTNLKKLVHENLSRQTDARLAADTQTLEGKQVQIHRVGPRAPASTILGLIAPRLAANPKHTIANFDGTDPIILFDTGPADPIVVVL